MLFFSSVRCIIDFSSLFTLTGIKEERAVLFESIKFQSSCMKLEIIGKAVSSLLILANVFGLFGVFGTETGGFGA